MMAGGSLAGGGLSFLGGQSQSKAMRDAMKQYINYQNDQRNLFLNQPQSTAIKDKLTSYIGGDVGYSDDVLSGMKHGVYEDYGKSLTDMNNSVAGAGLTPGGAYSPGRADRAKRRLGENIASNRAQDIRNINKENADVALNNQRFAVSALPTYMPGLSNTPQISPDVFQGLNSTAHPGSYFGPAISSTSSAMSAPYLQADAYGPIMEQMMKYMRTPQQAAMVGGPGPWAGGYQF
jgi:hypothetical protein